MTFLGPDPRYWREPWLYAYQERAAIMEESGVPDADARAEADIRRQAEQAGQGSIFGDTTPLREIGRR